MLNEMSLNLSPTNLKDMRDFTRESLSDRNFTVLEWLHDFASGGAKAVNVQRIWYAWTSAGSPDVGQAVLEIAAMRGGVKLDANRSAAKIKLDDQTVQKIIIFNAKSVEGRFHRNANSVQEFISCLCKGGLKDSSRQAVYFAYKNAGYDVDAPEVILADLTDAATRAGILG